MDDGDRLAPISLAVERPVVHLILNALFADAVLGEVIRHLLYAGFLIGHAVEEA